MLGGLIIMAGALWITWIHFRDGGKAEVPPVAGEI
jgi:hypothetical protein